MSVTTSQLIPVVAPVTGQKISLTTVADTVFLCGLRVANYPGLPRTDQIVAPIAGQVTRISNQLHNLGFRTANGLEVLIHLGLGTSMTAGMPFHLTVKLGEPVQAGQPIAEMDLAITLLNQSKPIVPCRIWQAFLRLKVLAFIATHRIAPDGNVDTKFTLDLAANHRIAVMGPPERASTESTQVFG